MSGLWMKLATLPTLTMVPDPRAIMWGVTAWVTAITPA
jgi:hypothetical protein